ncbi:hypothetical protein [Mycobacterium timonense]|nr:hypothetical protein [Mycobacterium timonense]
MEDWLSRVHHAAEHIVKHYDVGLVADFKSGTKVEIQVSKSAATRSA